MAEEDRLNGYNIIQNALLSPLTFYELVIKLVLGALEINKVRIGEKSNQECGTIYNERSVDTFIWALGIMCQEWILENLRKKSAEGHCWTHKQNTKQPCEKGAEFHKSLYEECRRTFEEVLKTSHL
jgi:hypothetical protein